MGLCLKSLLQVRALRLNGKSERLLETFYIACCCTLYIDATFNTSKAAPFSSGRFSMPYENKKHPDAKTHQGITANSIT